MDPWQASIGAHVLPISRERNVFGKQSQAAVIAQLEEGRIVLGNLESPAARSTVLESKDAAL